MAPCRWVPCFAPERAVAACTLLPALKRALRAVLSALAVLHLALPDTRSIYARIWLMTVFYFKVQPFIWSCAPFAHSFVVPHVFQFQKASRGCAKWGDASPAPDFISGQGSVPCASSRAPAVGRAPRTCEPTDPFPLPFLVAARFNQIQLLGWLLQATEVGRFPSVTAACFGRSAARQARARGARWPRGCGRERGVLVALPAWSGAARGQDPAGKGVRPGAVRNSECFPYRHLVAIFKDDKETFGFEIQVRPKWRVNSFENKIWCKLSSVTYSKLC